MRGVKADADEVATGWCPRCQAPVLRALVGRIAALDVSVDSATATPETEPRLRAQGHLTWCLETGSTGKQRLLWRDPEHVQSGKCSHAVLGDHVCAQPAFNATYYGRH